MHWAKTTIISNAHSYPARHHYRPEIKKSERVHVILLKITIGKTNQCQLIDISAWGYICGMGEPQLHPRDWGSGEWRVSDWNETYLCVSIASTRKLMRPRVVLRADTTRCIGIYHWKQINRHESRHYDWRSGVLTVTRKWQDQGHREVFSF